MKTCSSKRIKSLYGNESGLTVATRSLMRLTVFFCGKIIYFAADDWSLSDYQDKIYLVARSDMPKHTLLGCTCNI